MFGFAFFLKHDNTQSRDQVVGQGEVAMWTGMGERTNLMPAPSEEFIDVIRLCDQSGGARHNLPPILQVASVDRVPLRESSV